MVPLTLGSVPLVSAVTSPLPQTECRGTGGTISEQVSPEDRTSPVPCPPLMPPSPKSCSHTETPTLLQAQHIYWLQGNGCSQESKAFKRGGRALRGLWGFPSICIVQARPWDQEPALFLLVCSSGVVSSTGLSSELLFFGFVTWIFIHFSFVTWRFLSLSDPVTGCCTS